MRLIHSAPTLNLVSPQPLKYFYILACFYVATMIASLTVSARIMPVTIPFFKYVVFLTAGTWTIPFSFLLQSITTEVYGYARSRSLVFLTIFILSIYVSYLGVTRFFPIPKIDNIDIDYNAVFDVLPRHFMALIVSVMAGNLFNDYVLSRLKVLLEGKQLYLRLLVATLIGESIVQLIGTTVAWLGKLHFTTDIIPFVIFSYLYKLFITFLFIPIVYRVCLLLKREEGIDIYDRDITYNPFKWRKS